MKFKRILLLLCLLLSVAVPASASLAAFDDALSPLLSGRSVVEFSASMTLKTLLPFDETRIDLFNRILRHLRLSARIDQGADAQATEFRLVLGETLLMELTEQVQNGAYLLQTSLLPNRRLFSTQGSPMEALLADAPEAAEAPSSDPALNTSDVAEAFDLQAAAAELASCSRALTDKTVPLTEKKAANYSIKEIGKARISYVAKLTSQQSGAMLPELRALLSCGMDSRYREEVSQITFADGFVAALYQNADGEDLCVYLKGSVVYPDGGRRTIKWQWAFTPDGETQTFVYEAARESGTRDSRAIDAILERTQTETSYAWKSKTSVTLRRGSVVDSSVLTVDLHGDPGEPFTCKGSVKRVTESKTRGESAGKAETAVIVDLALTAAESGSELTGTADVLETEKGDAQLELSLAFLPAAADGSTAAATPAATAADASGQTPATSAEISILPAASTAPRPAEGSSSAGDSTAGLSEYLVGSAPVGLREYPVPAGIVSVGMDNAGSDTRLSLMSEAAQRLAGSLILALLDLPEEDRALLSDGMTDSDYAVFLALLD